MHRVLFLMLAGIFLGAPRAAAIWGVGDAVIIVGDATDAYKWGREAPLWHQLIANTREEILRTDDLTARVTERQDALRRLLGEPDRAGAAIGSVPDVMKPVNTAMELETEKHALESSRNLFSPGSKSVKAHNVATKVDKTYSALGETHTRDSRRYGHYAEQEAMYARYRTAALNQENVVKRETELQARTLEQMKSASTHARVAILTAVIAASQQRCALAEQKASQAKSDLDAFRGQLGFEEARKAEADREWAQTVIERLQAKALAAYKAQLRGVAADER